MIDLLSLAERVEGLEGPSREVDYLVADAVHGIVPAPFVRGHCEHYTASYDSAMTLIQDDWWFNCSAPMSPAAYGYSREDQRQPRAGVEMIGAPYSAGGRGATLPLAITAAALRARARAAQEQQP